MEIIPCRDGLRWCWSCQASYKDNQGEDNPEARCPACNASQAFCDRCGDPGAEACNKGCELCLCYGCWPRHLMPGDQPRPPPGMLPYGRAEPRNFCPGGGDPPVLVIPLEPGSPLNSNTAERKLVVGALEAAGDIIHAALLLGITRHALKRRIIKHRIEWPRSSNPRPAEATP